MQLREIMTLDVAVTRPDATLAEAAEQMKTLDVGLLPVCDGDYLVGMLTDRDITVRAAAAGSDPTTTCAPLKFTVIFEYGIHRTGCVGLKAWAQQWMNLATFTIGTETYDSVLAVITEQFVERNTNPAQLPNRSSLTGTRLFTLP